MTRHLTNIAVNCNADVQGSLLISEERPDAEMLGAAIAAVYAKIPDDIEVFDFHINMRTVEGEAVLVEEPRALVEA